MGIGDFLKQIAGGALNGVKSFRKKINEYSGPIKDFIKQVSPKLSNLVDSSQPIRDLLSKGLDYGLDSAGNALGMNDKPKFNITGDDVGKAFNAVGNTANSALQFL